MATVYVLESSWPYEGSVIHGIYDSVEDAENSIGSLGSVFEGEDYSGRDRWIVTPRPDWGDDYSTVTITRYVVGE